MAYISVQNKVELAYFNLVKDIKIFLIEIVFFPVLQQPRSECNIKFLMANIQVYISYQTDEIETLELLQDIRSDLKKKTDRKYIFPF